MTDQTIPNSWNTIRRYPKEVGPESRYTLRAYTYSPDCVAIQIRGEKSFATAILSDAQARLFAQMILDAVDGHRAAKAEGAGQ